ncbi:DUF3077 domain-containing protein [Pseudomonas lijiangensis]|uniref:DUF6124 family protein n=1 Tax=Pseudomonas syringae group TaxID=136849 RepID=UPI0019112181|nr:DUF3077 domain-containing protein [Pseudomonas cichorii]GFM65692.1 hypothetical protein PSCICJ_18100 [Pseudomonas cichorii]
MLNTEPALPLDRPSLPNPNTTLEQSLCYASELLSCAAATAYESSDHLSGTQRHLALSVVHLVELAKTVVDRSLNGVEVR